MEKSIANMERNVRNTEDYGRLMCEQSFENSMFSGMEIIIMNLEMNQVYWR